MVLDQIGLSGQIRFSKSIVSVIGAGGLESCALYFGAAGIGEIRIIDDDVVISRTRRGRSYTRKRRWCGKGGFCTERMRKIDSTVKIKIFKQKLTPRMTELI